jgi:hypothetical protein
MRFYSIGLAGAAALLAAGASVHAAAPGKDAVQQDCFRPDDILNSVQTSRTQMNIKTYSNHYFQIDTKGICFIGAGNLPYVIKSVAGGGGFICKAIDMDLVGGEPGNMLPCIVDKLTPLTKEQVMALPKKQQPG